MNDLVDLYQQQATARVSTTPWLAKLQTNALADFQRLGFPTRHNEEWKYTSVDAFLKQSFEACVDSFGMTATFPNNVPGLIVQPLAQALIEHPEKIQTYLGQILKHEHGFQALNTAMIATGFFIYIPENALLSEPVVISHAHNQTQQVHYVRHVIAAQQGSAATIIETYQGEHEYCVNTMTEVYAAKHAQVVHYKLQRESRSAYHFGHTAVSQDAHSRFDSHLFSFGGKLVRSDLSIDLKQPKASCFMNGIYAPATGQHMDHHTCVTHQVADCQSIQDYKGILSAQSRAVFNGKVIVAKDAQQTRAEQQNKNLLLSTHAEIDTKPQLEIFANDVICTHGSTVGQLDEEALFYLATRGLKRDEASRYLIEAFATDNLRAVENTQLAHDLKMQLLQQIGGL